ncbi:MAG TPA: response regulator [Gammaproteobacteria bacterium]|nr:response regulator [Gammaproteobacteria bacterium]
MIRILLVDDHEVVRTGIKMLLMDVLDIEIVGEAGNGEEAIRLARELVPDIILMDVNMPGIGGLEATIRLLRNEPTAKILIISAHTDDFLPARLLSLGAVGYLSKSASRDQMIEAINTIYAGNRYVDPIMMDNIVIPRLKVKDNKAIPLAKLSERELQILLMVARGMDVNEIAKKLFLSNKTVNGYRSTILKKLRVKTDVEATRIAIEYGLIDVDSQWH